MKCVVTSQGTLTVGSRSMMRAFHFVAVHEAAATMTGLGYVALALFVALCTGYPPAESRGWLWRTLRGILRWGSLVAVFVFWERACQLIHVSTPWPSLRSSEDFAALGALALCFSVVAVLCFLWAMFQREAVKRTLNENGCRPLHIWWRPAAFWAPFGGQTTAYRVVYLDPAGSLHRAYCCVSSFRQYSNGEWRRVRWLRDEVCKKGVEPSVFVDSEIVRRRLEFDEPDAGAQDLGAL